MIKLNTNFGRNSAILIANLLDHYDFYIYTLLAPYIARAFFVSDSVLSSLIKAYGIAHISIITRPLGAAFFGRIAGVIGPVRALRYCLMGVACATVLIGILPGYNQIGCVAAFLLLILRGLQSFCSSGESAIASLYILSDNPRRRSFLGSIYSLSTLLGMLMASKVCEIISRTTNPDLYWRAAFIIGFATSLTGVYIRGTKNQFVQRKSTTQVNVVKIISIYKAKIFRIAVLSAFSYISAPICFVIINAIVPIVQNISISEIMRLNTNLLIFDGFMILLSGYFLSFFKVEKFLLWCSFIILIFQIILLSIIPVASLDIIMYVRVLLITFGVPFAIALKVWLANVTDTHGQEKYFITALGTGIGIEILGRTIIVGSFYVFNLYQNFTLLIIYIVCLYLVALYCLLTYPKTTQGI